MKFLVTFIVLALVLLAITFSPQNTGEVNLYYFNFMSQPLPVYLLIFFSFLAGVVFSGFLGLVDRIRLRRTISKIRKELQNLETEIYNLRKGQLASEAPQVFKKEYLS
ncbi:MAG: LapA family protein [Syntrophaceae bacterium]